MKQQSVLVCVKLNSMIICKSWLLYNSTNTRWIIESNPKHWCIPYIQKNIWHPLTTGWSPWSEPPTVQRSPSYQSALSFPPPPAYGYCSMLHTWTSPERKEEGLVMREWLELWKGEKHYRKATERERECGQGGKMENKKQSNVRRSEEISRDTHTVNNTTSAMLKQHYLIPDHTIIHN